MNSTLIGLLYVFRHGQRSPYPPPFAKHWEDARAAGWTNRPEGFSAFTPAAWNMTQAAFDGQELAPNGARLHHHLGQYVAQQALGLGGALCEIPSLLVADDSVRDVQSAHAFASGFFPPGCAVAKAAAILTANGSFGLRPATSDRIAPEGCGHDPDEAGAELLFGSTEALTSRYRPHFKLVSEILGCCSASLCAQYGIQGGRNCTLDELPYTFTGTYYEGLYQGPLSAAASITSAWMLQALAGVPNVAWGEVTTDEQLLYLFEVQARLKLLGSNTNRSRAVGSHLLGFLVSSLEQLVHAEGPGLEGAAPGSPQFLALFAHDFNILYLRRLLGASWLTDSWGWDQATTGASVSFELYEESDPTATARRSSYRVVGVLTAASMEQQRSAAPLVPPHGSPPGRSVFLDMPYEAFKAQALAALDPRCVSPPLKSTIAAMLADEDQSPADAWGKLIQSGQAMAIGALFLLAGCAFGFLAGRGLQGARARIDNAADPFLNRAATKPMASAGMDAAGSSDSHSAAVADPGAMLPGPPSGAPSAAEPAGRI